MHKKRRQNLCGTAEGAKVKKLMRKRLTNKNKSAIICRLSDGARMKGGVGECRKSQNFKKLFKKLLTKSERCGILHRSPEKGRQPRGLGRSLTIEQQEIKVQARSLVRKNLEFLWKKRTWVYHGLKAYSKKSKEPKKLDEKDLGRGSGIDTICSRVWSWLRMNAGGVHNTFKSNGEGTSVPEQWRTGE